MGLGDIVEAALQKVGVTEERVTKWLGKPCGCRGRKKKLNDLSQWASRLLTGKTTPDDGAKNLGTIMGQEIEQPKPDPEREANPGASP